MPRWSAMEARLKKIENPMMNNFLVFRGSLELYCTTVARARVVSALYYKYIHLCMLKSPERSLTMWEIADRIILMIISYCFFIVSDNSTESFIYFCIILSFSGFLYCSRHQISISILLIGYGILSFFNPAFIYFTPGLFLDYKKLTGWYRLGYLSLLPAVYFISQKGLPTILLFVLFTAISLLLFYKTKLLEDSQRELIVTKDSSTELQMILEDKNRNLIARQDTEIHLARLQERNRIAREIHDNVGHLLTRSILQTKAISTISKEEALKEPLAQVSDTLNQAMNNIRSSVHDLHDESIDLESGIRQALTCLKEFKVSLDYDISHSVPKEYKYALIAIAKETSNNIAKHSNGNTATYILREHPALYQFSIEDNGLVDSGKLGKDGMGLQSIRTRVEQLKGHMNMKTENGFHIFITLPKQ